MFFYVFSPKGLVLYEGYSWPMARAALDSAVLKDDGCPMLNICPEEPQQKPMVFYAMHSLEEP